MPLAWIKILIPAERERETERERERVVAFLFYAFHSLLMFLDSPIFCQIGQFYHL